MFLQFYGMREQPFGVTPNPRYLHFSRTHREALASLFCGVQDQRGFLALIAPPGTGKTTLLSYLLERLRPWSRTAFVFDTPSDPEDLMSQIAVDFGLDTADLTTAGIRQQFYKLLSKEAQAGKNVVIVVDEAQNLSDLVLERLRLLSNFETGTHKLLQVVLAGQPSLVTRLAHPDLVQLQQRLAIVTDLKPLTREEVSDYIEHRLCVAGCDTGVLFTRDALALVASETKGIPRSINILCYNALALGCAQKCKRIDTDIVEQVADDLALKQVPGDLQMNTTSLSTCSSQGQISVHNESATHGRTERGRRIATSGKMLPPFPPVLAGVALAIATLLIAFSSRVTSLSRRELNLKSPIPLTRPITTPSLTALAATTTPAAPSISFIQGPSFVTDIRYRSESDSTTVGVELERQVKYEVHRLTSPNRIYLDLYGSRLTLPLVRKRLQINDAIVRKIRIAERTGMVTRVTLETYGDCDFSVAATPDSPELLVQLRTMQKQSDSDAAVRDMTIQPIRSQFALPSSIASASRP